MRHDQDLSLAQIKRYLTTSEGLAHINDQNFANLVESIKQAGQLKRGELQPSRTFEFHQSLRDKQAKMIPENRPTHPGEFVRDLILDEFDLTQAQLAKALGVSRRTIDQLVDGKRNLTAGMAWRLGKFTKTTPQLWMNLQITLDLWDALHAFEEQEIESIQPYMVVV